VFASAGPVRIGVDSVLWQRFASGGRLRDPVTVRLPSLRRIESVRLAVVARTATAPDAPLAVAFDRDAPSRVALLPGHQAWLVLPSRAADGAEVTLSPAGPTAVDGLIVEAGPELGRAAAAGLAAGLIGLILLGTRPT
jgi:hypothetical protein